ncbi:lactate dehydrogenase-like oxidoreductase [Desulfosporosinus orientis DSM 765]|uniref:Lactate dehydrogenase-like oxidoreductase n=1 Tax=Desulfosporosinus orientis (strain ATCC 19365 / DSM 765 / NCIMB 8382 / VKM B-1628 / Singapore I) TaxID=768706 RepID=G7WIA4_DESOD|nr:D-glycerate dehydrogenase [Desulfosporosinus orientis]AET68552.1 lactate dehydrogenase-like oxidoreductase [Desulfosporosinus orientis DSM 765]
MLPKVFIAKPIPQTVRDYLGKFCEFAMWDKERPINRQELIEQISDREGLLTTSLITRIDEDLLLKAPNLRIVSNISVGYDNFDLEAMRKRQVLGTNTPDVLSDTVADLAIGLMLCSARRIVELNGFVKEGKWNAQISEELFGLDLHHQTLGIIGMGSIGLELARRARNGFKMDVLYHNRNRKIVAEEELGVRYCDLPTLLAKSDFVILLTPLTKDTKHLMGYKEFNLMKHSAFFLNISRGETVDEQALILALREEKIQGAALDVFSQEPINKNNPLLQFQNVITVPHIGSATLACRTEMAMLAAKNLAAGLMDIQPPNLVKELY